MVPDMGVKASGGARSYEDALAFIEAGATRIGASSGVAIMKERCSVATTELIDLAIEVKKSLCSLFSSPNWSRTSSKNGQIFTGCEH